MVSKDTTFDDLDFYFMSVGRYLKADLAREFFEGLEKKGYLIHDIGKLKEGGIFVCGEYYNFREIDKVPIKRDSLESKV